MEKTTLSFKTKDNNNSDAEGAGHTPGRRPLAVATAGAGP